MHIVCSGYVFRDSPYLVNSHFSDDVKLDIISEDLFNVISRYYMENKYICILRFRFCSPYLKVFKTATGNIIS